MAKGNMTDDILKVLIEEDAIAEKVKELGAKISADYAGKKLLVLGVLKGSFVFMPISSARSPSPARSNSWLFRATAPA